MPNKSIIAFSIICYLLSSILSSTVVWSQVSNKEYIINEEVIHSNDIVGEYLKAEVIELLILDKINARLKSKALNTFKSDTTLKLAATDQAKYMAFYKNATLEQDTKDRYTTSQRLVFYKGSIHAEELIAKTNLSKSGKNFTYEKIADDIVFSWLTSKKKALSLESGQYNLIGISVKPDSDQKRVYVSAVLGNYKSTNVGTAYKNSLPVPYSEKNYGLSSPLPSICKKVNRANHLNELHDRLVIEDHVIYYETDNIKEISKIIKNKKDGLAIEFLQREQFSCSLPNIIDHNLPQSGVITKRIYKKKLFKNNLADLEENKRAFKGEIAVIPEGLNDDFEANLVIIQEKHFCRSIPQNFIIQTNGTYQRNVLLLADSVNINSRFNYKPTPDTSALSFKIPFENNKANYKTKDIEPFISLLNEPAFLIFDISITAYSSVEGRDDDNRKLQKQRANSIIKALEKRHTDSIRTSIIADYNRKDFDQDIRQTKHASLASMSVEEIQDYIRKNNLKKELEPILSQHRYAQIDMQVISDITGDLEKPFVIQKFHEAVENEDRALALSIEKFIMKQIAIKRFPPNTIAELTIPIQSDYAGILMNKYWMMHTSDQLSDEDLQLKVEELYELDSDNEYIAFNHLFLQITSESIEIGDPRIQPRIDRLYYTPLQKKTVDALNIKYQLRLISKLDSVSTDGKEKEASIQVIKRIVNIKDETLENSLKLAELFIDNKDYLFAIKTLEPWLNDREAGEKLYFTYISLCSQYEHKMHTDNFNYAMTRAQELNSKRYCELFNGEYFSLRVFENNVIKESYCEHCQP